MCIDKENNTCCCGCSLTTATAILAALVTVGAILQGVQENWAGLGIELGMALLLGLSVYKKKNVTLRKINYYVWFTMTILNAIILTIAIIALSVMDIPEVDDQFRTECLKNDSLYPEYIDDLDQCIDFINTVAIVALVFCLLIGSFIGFLLTRMLYYGMKE